MTKPIFERAVEVGVVPPVNGAVMVGGMLIVKRKLDAVASRCYSVYIPTSSMIDKSGIFSKTKKVITRRCT